jgi:large subunit ribosomal protein L30
VAKLRITLVKSPNGYSPDQVSTIKTLGLHKINQFVVREDSLSLRGQVMKVKHLVMVKEGTNAAEGFVPGSGLKEK